MDEYEIWKRGLTLLLAMIMAPDSELGRNNPKTNSSTTTGSAGVFSHQGSPVKDQSIIKYFVKNGTINEFCV